MTLWKVFEDWTYEHFDREAEPEALPGFEHLVRLWRDKRGERAVPSWSDFDFYDFTGWHSRISVYEIFYEPFDYVWRLSGSTFDEILDGSMTGVKGSDLAELRIEHPEAMAFYEMVCRRMLIARVSGSVNLKARRHVKATFVEFPLSDDGLKATHTFEAVIVHGRD